MQLAQGRRAADAAECFCGRALLPQRESRDDGDRRREEEDGGMEQVACAGRINSTGGRSAAFQHNSFSRGFQGGFHARQRRCAAQPHRPGSMPPLRSRWASQCLLLLAGLACASGRPFKHMANREFFHQFHARLDRVPHDYGRNETVGRFWFQINFEPSVRCMLDERVGAAGDGGKWVCDPSILLKGSPACTVFSVGSQNVWDFEEGIHNVSAKCQIDTWDHTLKEVVNKPEYVNLHAIGLSEKNATNLADLSQMMEIAKVDHIDVLKVDCEGCEWNWLLHPGTFDLLKEKVTQLLIEFHWLNSDVAFAAADGLTKAGFRVFSKEPNIMWSDGSCIEYSFINLHRIDEGTRRRALVDVERADEADRRRALGEVAAAA